MDIVSTQGWLAMHAPCGGTDGPMRMGALFARSLGCIS